MHIPNNALPLPHVKKMLVTFENHIGLGSTYAARLLGVAYPTYAAYRSGSRALPEYHERHIQALMLLDGRSLKKLIEEHAHGTRERRG
jgi:hypothetical protein